MNSEASKTESVPETIDTLTIKRLAATEESDAGDCRKSGNRLGEKWARENATARQLRRIAKADDALVFDSQPGDSDLAALIYKVIHCQKSATTPEVLAFWDEVTEETDSMSYDAVYSEEFALGFVEGARRVLEAYEESC